METKTKLKAIAVIAGLAIVLLLGSASLSVAGAPAKPGMIRWVNYDIGTSSYGQGMAVAEGILKKFGIKVRTLPLGSGVGRIMAAKTGTSDIFWTGSVVAYARKGTHDFATAQWGPQPIRTVWAVNRRSSSPLATTTKSGIEKLEDLKGKRVAFIVGSPAVNAAIEGALGLVGLSWEDVQKVELPSIGAGYRALKDGKVHCFVMNSTGSFAYEMEASPGGLYWIPYPKYEANPEGWKRFGELYAGVYPGYMTLGAGVSEEKPVHTVLWPIPILCAYESVDEELIYWQVKAIVEAYDLYKEVIPDGPGWSLERNSKAPLIAPWHDGAIKYLKEVGRWTDEMQKAHNEMLALDRKTKKLWDDVIEESIEKKVKSKEFEKFWLEKLKAAGY